MRHPEFMRYLKPALKLLVSVAIIALILRKIDERLLLRVMAEADAAWVLWAVLWFALSKLIAAWRFNLLLETEGIRLPVRDNLRLYWLGMYYNLLLPGGISGDGYKIKILMDAYGKPFKRLFTLTLLDRLTGAIALGQLLLLLLPGIPVFRPWTWLITGAWALSLPATWWAYRWAGGRLAEVWVRASGQSILVQLAQAVATLGLIVALGQELHWLEYSALFLVSSVVAMLPLTVGGAGARELTFLVGAEWLQVDPEQAVAIAFLFYLISTAVSLGGLFFSFRATPLEKNDEA